MNNKKLSNKPEKGNWEKAAWEVKAQNNSLFAEAFALGWLVPSCPNDSRLKTLLQLKIAEILPILRDFVLFKLGDEAEYVLQRTTLIDLEKVAVDKGLLSKEQLNRIKMGNGTPEDFEAFYSTQIELGADGALWGGETYLKLARRVKGFLDYPTFDSLRALVEWTHYSGSLFTGSTAKKAPLTEDFAEYLSSGKLKNLKDKDLYAYCSDQQVRVVLLEYLEAELEAW